MCKGAREVQQHTDPRQRTRSIGVCLEYAIRHFKLIGEIDQRLVIATACFGRQASCLARWAAMRLV